MSSILVGSFLGLAECYGVAFVSVVAAWLHQEHSLNPFEMWLFVAIGAAFVVLMVAIQSQSMTNGINRALNFIFTPPSDVSTSRWLLIMTVSAMSDVQWLLVFQASILMSPAECWSIVHSCDIIIIPFLLLYLFNRELGWLSIAGLVFVLTGLILTSISVKHSIGVLYAVLAALLQVFNTVGHRLIKPSHEDEQHNQRAQNAAEAYRHSTVTKTILMYIQFIVASVLISFVSVIYFAGINPGAWHNPFELMSSSQPSFFSLCGISLVSVGCVLLKTMNLSTVGYHMYSVLVLLVIPVCLLCQLQFGTNQPSSPLFFSGMAVILVGGAMRARDAWSVESRQMREDFSNEDYQRERLEESDSENSAF